MHARWPQLVPHSCVAALCSPPNPPGWNVGVVEHKAGQVDEDLGGLGVEAGAGGWGQADVRQPSPELISGGESQQQQQRRRRRGQQQQQQRRRRQQQQQQQQQRTSANHTAPPPLQMSAQLGGCYHREPLTTKGAPHQQEEGADRGGDGVVAAHSGDELEERHTPQVDQEEQQPPHQEADLGMGGEWMEGRREGEAMKGTGKLYKGQEG